MTQIAFSQNKKTNKQTNKNQQIQPLGKFSLKLKTTI